GGPGAWAAAGCCSGFACGCWRSEAGRPRRWTPAFTERERLGSKRVTRGSPARSGRSAPGGPSPRTSLEPVSSATAERLIRVGTCSWTDPTLIESGWYPERIKDDADKRLRYYAEHFPIVENDAAFYALPSQKQALLWAERTPDEFVMNFKAFATLTTHHTDPKRLPKDIRETLPKEAPAKQRVYPKDFPKDAR